LAFHFSLSLTPNCRNWSPNYLVLVCLRKAVPAIFVRHDVMSYKLPIKSQFMSCYVTVDRWRRRLLRWARRTTGESAEDRAEINAN
jgi:hypothetical protein